MNTTLRYLGLNAQNLWANLVNEHLQHLRSLTPMTAAAVELERRREAKPAYRVRVHLEVPGPDLRAEAADFTLHAAMLKAVRAIEQKIHSRRQKRVERHKRRPQVSGISGHWSAAFAGQRA